MGRINSAVIPKDLQNINIPYIPFHGNVLLKKVRQGERTSVGGLLILPEVGTNSGSVGRVVAKGPQVSDYVRIGALVSFNPMEDIETIILGENYIEVHEMSIKGMIIDDEQVRVLGKPIDTESEKRKIRIDRYNNGKKGMAAKHANMEDKYEEKAKNKRKNPSKYK